MYNLELRSQPLPISLKFKFVIFLCKMLYIPAHCSATNSTDKLP